MLDQQYDLGDCLIVQCYRFFVYKMGMIVFVFLLFRVVVWFGRVGLGKFFVNCKMLRRIYVVFVEFILCLIQGLEFVSYFRWGYNGYFWCVVVYFQLCLICSLLEFFQVSGGSCQDVFCRDLGLQFVCIFRKILQFFLVRDQEGMKLYCM